MKKSAVTVLAIGLNSNVTQKATCRNIDLFSPGNLETLHIVNFFRFFPHPVFKEMVELQLL
jgi:hypothetical protein